MSAVFPVNEDPRWRIHDASPGQTVFTIPYPFQDAADITVVKIAADGARTELSQPADYTVSGAGNPGGGSYTLAVPAQAGEKYLNFGDAVMARTSSIVRMGKFSSVAIDEDIDRALIRDLELRRDVQRAVQVEIGEDGLTIESIPEGHFWLAGPDGRMIDGGSAADIAAAQGYAVEAKEARDEAQSAQQAAEGAADRAQSYAAMLSADKVKFPTVAGLLADEVMSYAASPGLIEVGAGDIVEAQGYRYEVAADDAADHHIETAGGVKLYVLPDASGRYFPEQVGAKADGVSDDSAAILKTVSIIPSNDDGTQGLAKGGTLGMEAGKTYYCGITSITVNKAINIDASEAELLFDADFGGIGLDIKRATNLLTNPSFENDLGSWTRGSGNSSVIYITNEANNGSKAVRLLRDTEGNQLRSIIQTVDVTPGKVYTWSAHVKSDIKAGTGAFFLAVWLDGSNNILSQSAAVDVPIDTWYTWHSTSFTPPEGAVRARFYVRCHFSGSHSYVDVDDVCLNVAGNDGLMWYQTLNLPRVRKTYTAGRVTWDRASVGIRLSTIRTSLTYVPMVNGFRYGLVLEGDGSGFVQGRLRIGTLRNNWSAFSHRSASGGWINENTYYDGKYEIGSGIPDTTYLDDLVAQGKYVRFLEIATGEGTTRCNRNIWFHPAMEIGSTSQWVTQIHCEDGGMNLIYWPRLEGGREGSVFFGAGSDRNSVEGLDPTEIQRLVVNNGTRNSFRSVDGEFIGNAVSSVRAVLTASNAHANNAPAIGAKPAYKQWKAGMEVTAGDYVHTFPSSSNCYVATTTGTTGGTAPSGTGTGISDGGVTWDYVGHYLDALIAFTGDGKLIWPRKNSRYLALDSANRLVFLGMSGDEALVPSFRTNPPASASAPGIKGQMAFDGSYLYICVDTDTWMRVGIATW